MKINTSRFGEIEIKESEIISFPNGLLGFPELTQMTIVRPPDEQVFEWLQSCSHPHLTFPILEIPQHVSSYNPSFLPEDMDFFGSNLNGAKLYGVVTIPNDPVHMTINLRAPIVTDLEGMKARQCVAKDMSLQIRHPIFDSLVAFMKKSAGSNK